MSPAPINKITALSNFSNTSILFSSISVEPSIRLIKSSIVKSPVFSLIEPNISHKILGLPYLNSQQIRLKMLEFLRTYVVENGNNIFFVYFFRAVSIVALISLGWCA